MNSYRNVSAFNILLKIRSIGSSSRRSGSTRRSKSGFPKQRKDQPIHDKQQEQQQEKLIPSPVKQQQKLNSPTKQQQQQPRHNSPFKQQYPKPASPTKQQHPKQGNPSPSKKQNHPPKQQQSPTKEPQQAKKPKKPWLVETLTNWNRGSPATAREYM